MLLPWNAPADAQDPLGDLIEAVTSAGQTSTPPTAATTSHPVPKPRPSQAQRTLMAFVPGLGGGNTIQARRGTLKQALEAVDGNDILKALAIRASLRDPIDKAILTWRLARHGDPLVPYAMIAEFQTNYPDFPTPITIRRNAERALARETTNYRQVLSAYGNADPISVQGTIHKAEALLAEGEQRQAARIIRKLWRTSRLSGSFEADILNKFGALLRSEDHKFRADMHAYEERSSEATRIAKLLGRDYQALIKARNAVNDGARNAKTRLSQVPRSMRKDPGFIFSKVQHLRRTGHPRDSAALLQTAPTDPSLLIDPDEWWVERRIGSRNMLDLGRAQQAYDIAAAHRGGSPATIAEAEFHAGWYALRFLKKPRLARPHFERIAAIASRARSLARAYYWLGRTEEAMDRTDNARDHYARAAQYPDVYYGQLAHERLGKQALNLIANPVVDGTVRQRHAARPAVQAIDRLMTLGDQRNAATFMRALAQKLTDSAEIVLLAERAEKADMHPVVLQIGRLADQNGHRLPEIAFPIAGIPKSAKIPDSVGKGLVYAVARQESGFNPTIGSGAGALGLLQLMPATAREVSGELGLRYAKSKLTKDPAYNVTLGAAYLDKLIGNFDGSLVLTFVGYNAGGSRARNWSEKYGDPRFMAVDDVIDWVERIPFTETRGYVQKLLENKQVYQARLHEVGLTLYKDLQRGG